MQRFRWAPAVTASSIPRRPRLHPWAAVVCLLLFGSIWLFLTPAAAQIWEKKIRATFDKFARAHSECFPVIGVNCRTDNGRGYDYAPHAGEPLHEIVFVDTTVENYPILVSGIDSFTEVVLLDSRRDGVEQIAEVLAGRSGINAVHSVTHGHQAELQLGTARLNLDSMTGEYADELALIGRALTDGADFMVYGCNFGEGDLGRDAAVRLAELTGADIAASNDLTGAEALGGDWTLEVATGSIETEVAVNTQTQANWSGLLDTVTVTTNADVLDGDADTSSLAALKITPGADGFISLREAIVASNTSVGVADTINLPADTYTLGIAGMDEEAAATGDLDITDDLTITGAGAATTTIDGNALDRVIDVTATGSLSMSGVTLQGGDVRSAVTPYGGGIRSGSGSLTLTNVVLTGNFADQGGGISDSVGGIVATDVEISGNTASLDGGGHYSPSPSTGGTFTKVLFDNNTAGNQGGGAYLAGAANVTTFTNTTFSGNGATDDGGGIYMEGDTLTLQNVTMTGNSSTTQGGGLMIQPGGRTIDLRNNIIADNTAPTGPNVNGTVDTTSNNWIKDSSGSSGWDSDFLDLAGLNLGALADNGGFTSTHALLGGSRGIDEGTNTGAPTDDQRGYIRFDGNTDIGAYEFGGGLLITARETIDDDANGQIDYIKITTDQPLNDNFADLTMTVSSYTVTGYVTEIGAGGFNDNVFYVQLTESGTPDTGVKPTVTVTANTLLTDLGGAHSIVPDRPTESKIAFYTQRDGNDEIYVMDADGSNPTNLTNNAATDWNPSWSPDGTEIAFDSDRDGNFEVYVMDADGSNPTNLTNNAANDLDPSWSPDANKIAFVSNRDGNYEIYVMDADGSNPVRLTNDGAFDMNVAWSPNGSKIAFESDRQGNWEIYLMDPDGSNLINLTNNIANDWNPSWSSDGSKIAFDSDRDGDFEIYVMDADGSNPINLTNNPAQDNSPSWSFDDTRIAFDSDRDGDEEIYVMDADGSGPINLTNDASADRGPEWWQDSYTLATDTAPPVLLAAPSTQGDGTSVFQVAWHRVDFVFSETLSGVATELELEAALTFGNGATDGDNLPSIGGGANPFTLATTTSVNDTIQVIFKASNTANTDLLLVGTHTVQVTDGTNITDISGNPAATAAVAVPITGDATSVHLTSFTAAGCDGAVELRWETGSEMDNLGFHLYRGTTATGPYERITSHVLPGLGSSPEGAQYSYLDKDLVNGVTYYYRLEDIETTGATELHGPVYATPQQGLPLPSREIEETSGGSSNASITYGDPLQNELRVLEQNHNHMVLELWTAGFYATPQEDGTVAIEVPGFEDYSEVGSPQIPTRRIWLEAIAGLKVNLASAQVQEVDSVALRPAAAEATEIVSTRWGTVRTNRSSRKRPRTMRGEIQEGKSLYPSEAVRIVSVGFQGEVKKAEVEMAPIRWDGERSRLLLARRLVVRITFAGRELSEVSTGGTRGRRYRRRAGQPARNVVARLATTEKGLYAVSFEEIYGGRRGGVPSDAMRLSRLGEPVAFHVEPAGRQFRPGSVLYFFSEGASANPYGHEAVYEMEVGAYGETMTVSSAKPSGLDSEFYRHRLELEQNRLYQPTLIDAPDIWLWDLVFSPQTKSYSFSVSALALVAATSRLELTLVGASDFPAVPDHHVRVYVNGSLVHEGSWDGKNLHPVEATIMSGILKEGENLLQIENVGDTEAAYSIVALDRFSVDYPRQLMADGGKLEGAWSESGVASVSGLGSGTIVLDVTEHPRWLTEIETSAADTVRFQAEPGRRYVVLAPEAVIHPDVKHVTRSGLRNESHQADYLVIGPRDLLFETEPLLKLREDQGLTVKAVAVEDITSEFGFGEARPEAIRDFLTYAYHNWSKPSLRYVVLLGDATYDYKDNLKTGVTNQVPSLAVKTRFLWTVSDPAYASVNGDDILPDISVGRLPAASIEEARAMVAKILAYETGEVNRGPVVLVADNPDEAGNFEANMDEIARGLPVGASVEKIYLDRLGTAAAREAVLAAFDEGISLMSYVGHGGIHLWADENLLNIWQVGGLSPQKLQPILLTMNCLNGYFHFPYFNSLAEELLKAEDKGAIAAFSPSGLSLNHAAHLYHQTLLTELFHENHERLGDAILAAQEAYAETGAYSELLSIYHLFGDPALRLR